MKITSDQLAALRNGQVQTTRPVGQDSFETLLTQALDSGAATSAQGVAAAPPLPGMLGVTGVMSATESQSLASGVEQVLDQWDAYAREIGNTETADLRKAYDQLEAITGTVQDLKGKAADASPAMRSLIDELDVMAVTEKIKFNRGDYA